MMKKITWGLLALLIGQPIVVYIGQAALLTTIPNHYGLLGAIAYTSDPYHYLAMFESMLIPASWLSWGVFIWTLGGAMILLVKLLGALGMNYR
ncbi:hypothetical protein DQM20_00255 [Lactiplantibacillus plantarum]|nr:hypothetical protein DQM20_00255 [Lactiplantibacillus plantarum]